MKILKEKSTRIIAFVSACIIFAICAVSGLSDIFSNKKIYDKYNSFYMRSAGSHEEAEEIFSKLWVVGNMYLRNLDENGKFTGSDELKNSTEKALKELEIMDSKGNITITKSENFDYYVSWGENSISTDNKSYDEIYKSDVFSITMLNDTISHSSSMGGYSNYYDGSWYTTDYGMTYYDFPHTINNIMASAVYDYDTTELDYYIDNYGVKIYYKKDGSTPVPNPEECSSNFGMEVYYNEQEPYYDRYGNIVEVPEDEEIEKVTVPASLLKDNDNSYILYNNDENKWVKVKENTKNIGNEIPLKICVSPSEKILPIYQQLESDMKKAEKNITRSLLGLIPFIVIVVVLMGYFVVADGYDVKQKKFVMNSVDKIFAEIIIAVIFGLGIAFIGSFELIYEFYDVIEHSYSNPQAISAAAGSFLLTLIFALFTLTASSIIKRFKCRSFWKTTFTSRIWKIFVKIMKRIYKKIKSISAIIKDTIFSKDMHNNNVFAKRFMIKHGLFIFAILLFASINSNFDIWSIIFIISVVYIFSNLKDIKAMTELSKQINDIYDGDYSEKEVHMDSPTYTMTEKLNNISDGIQTAVDKRIQSERMKIDLVTNVSHDLKTPLTSIISYINLLSMEELSPVARDYVKILEQKSERLHEIVADVFDIAKATSRTDINFEMIDAVILVEQVLADMTDRIDKSGREIRKTISAETAPIYADGKKLYRVLQNLIDNALKYSLENTRIYLTLKKENGNAVITLKNISSYEIKFTPEEITERFTRGDESRTTEGNGLGLSIAKSFTEACGGSFEIIIDGDVFEADITLPVTIKEK